MKIKQKIITLVIFAFASMGMTIGVAQTSHAASTPQTCGEAKTSIIACTGSNGKSAKENPIWQILIMVLNILAAGVGIAAVGGIAYAAILYSSAGDNAAQTKKAIEVITNIVIGIVAYGLMYLVLNYLIPGGIFS